jgi:hypothetical protein
VPKKKEKKGKEKQDIEPIFSPQNSMEPNQQESSPSISRAVRREFLSQGYY